MLASFINQGISSTEIELISFVSKYKSMAPEGFSIPFIYNAIFLLPEILRLYLHILKAFYIRHC